MCSKSLGGFGRTRIPSKYPLLLAMLLPGHHATLLSTLLRGTSPPPDHSPNTKLGSTLPEVGSKFPLSLWKPGYCRAFSSAVVPGEQKQLLTTEAATEKSNGFFAAYP